MQSHTGATAAARVTVGGESWKAGRGAQAGQRPQTRGRPQGVGVALLVVLALLACKKAKPTPAAPALADMKATGKFVGNYTIESARNPGGGTYSGDVAIKQQGEVYRLDWKLAAGTQFGVGIESGTALGVGLAEAEPFGVVMYLVNGGELNGTWALPSSPKLGSEQLSGPAGLNGTYKIVKGLNPDGSQYTGTVAISPRGKLYDVAWTVPGNDYKGTGVLSGNTFAVGWGTGKNVGVVLYTDAAGKLSGQWGQPAGTELGLETLAKK